MIIKHLKNNIQINKYIIISIIICLIFSTAYSTLSVIKHENYGSFGYDLGINNQVVWRYSNLQLPYTTSDPFPTETKLVTHVELIYIILSPLYWIYPSAKTLLSIEAVFFCLSGTAIFLIAKRKNLNNVLSFSLLISYLMFYGVQNALWYGVHSASFASALIAWFIYAIEHKKIKLSLIFCILAITSKENIGMLTFLISIIYFIKKRNKYLLIFSIISILYVIFIYFIYFPHIINQEYLYQNKRGLLSNINPISLIDSKEKISTIIYSLGSFGFLPIITPLALIPFFGDLASYFVLASELKSSHGIFMHYRITLAPILAWATILTIHRFKFLNNKLAAVYIISSAMFFQYYLHLPLSYLTKSWFWKKPESAKSINTLKRFFDKKDSIVAQNNILPHLSRRNSIYSLYPEKKDFMNNSPCGESNCNWFRWHGQQEYLIVDISKDWDARHLLTDRDNFVDGLKNLETKKVIKKFKQVDTTIIYKILKNPEEIK